MSSLKELFHILLQNPGKVYDLPEERIIGILEEGYQFLSEQQQLIRVDGEFIVVGDTHGDAFSSVSALRRDISNIIFLGDYVDRGPYQFENIMLLIVAMLSRERNIILLRGNHESPLMNRYYGFLNVLKNIFSSKTNQVYDSFLKVFSNMPYAAVINGSIFLVHGGIANELRYIDKINRLPKNDIIPTNSISFQLLWNDPDESVKFFAPSPRGEGIFLYGRDAVEMFLQENGLEKIVRAHEYFYPGIKTFFDEKVITIFSCRYYPIESPKAILIDENNEISIMSLL
ncbi:MAG: serine/threonine protein phosphatase [Thermofilum sp. ex4484_79]|nr:MAG: serine/threonine protein phosphatase [Thermofilum sp. ex4484_79]